MLASIGVSRAVLGDAVIKAKIKQPALTLVRGLDTGRGEWPAPLPGRKSGHAKLLTIASSF